MNCETHSRRSVLRRAASLALATQFPAILRAASSADEAQAALERAHTELWRRFVDKQDVLLDFTELDSSVSLPTPEECRAGKPNALGWWTPIENGAMFNGLYLDGAVNRALQTKADADNTKARRLVDGLLRLASCSSVKGFVGRGFASDGKTTWPMGSNDQTGPWFYGLWRHAQSGLPDAALRQRIIAKMTEVAEVLERTGWRMPAEPPFNFRGSFSGFSWDSGPRLPFVLKALHSLTGDAKWERLYQQSLHERRGSSPTRLATCERGLEFRTKPFAWTGSVSVACLRGLWELERDTKLRDTFAKGLTASATFIAQTLPLCRNFKNDSQSYFEGDWRKMNAFWHEQKTEDEASELAHEQLSWINKQSPRRREELAFVREPAFAAWIVTLCPDRTVVDRHRDAVLETLAHYRYDRLRYSQFFPVENAWRRRRRDVTATEMEAMLAPVVELR